jgi:hypothetical protein
MNAKNLVFECPRNLLLEKLKSQVKLSKKIKSYPLEDFINADEVIELIDNSLAKIKEVAPNDSEESSEIFYKVYAKRKRAFRKNLSYRVEELLYKKLNIPVDDEDLLRWHFIEYSRPIDKFSEDWFCDYFDRKSSLWNLETKFSNVTDSGNFACGDEAEYIYSQPLGQRIIYWAMNSSGGHYGPFLDVDEAISALGYTPATLKRRRSWKKYQE